MHICPNSVHEYWGLAQGAAFNGLLIAAVLFTIAVFLFKALAWQHPVKC